MSQERVPLDTSDITPMRGDGDSTLIRKSAVTVHKIQDILSGGIGMTPPANAYDTVIMDPPSKPATITFKLGGVDGDTVATLTVVYSGNDIQSVTRS
jgi:hypothetical protein